MVITYYGLSCFKIQSGDTVLATDPYDKDSGLTPPRFQTDVVTVSHNHENHSNIDALSSKSEEGVFKITVPGEYEIKVIRVNGVESYHDSKNGADKGRNTVFVIEWEGMRLVHLGDYGESSLRNELLEAIGTPDILFIPVGGADTIDAEEAAKLLNQVEPRIIIPMHYKISGIRAKLDGVEMFMKEMGEKVEPEEKFTIKKSGLPNAEESKIVILKTP